MGKSAAIGSSGSCVCEASLDVRAARLASKDFLLEGGRDSGRLLTPVGIWPRWGRGVLVGLSLAMGL